MYCDSLLKSIDVKISVDPSQLSTSSGEVFETLVTKFPEIIKT